MITRRLKRAGLLVLLLVLGFWVFVEIMNRDSKNMSVRQKVLKAVYPVWMWWNKTTGRHATRLSKTSIPPPISFYSLHDTLNDGRVLEFSTLRGKKVLLVNTASDCGYTSQYKELEQLYRDNKESLVVIAFPANDFKHQEKGNDSTIAEFCRKNYGISFPLTRKSSVIRSAAQNPVFQWLTDSTKNGWNEKAPSWNFAKYLVDEQGNLTDFFGPSISPQARAVKDAIQKK